MVLFTFVFLLSFSHIFVLTKAGYLEFKLSLPDVSFNCVIELEPRSLVHLSWPNLNPHSRNNSFKWHIISFRSFFSLISCLYTLIINISTGQNLNYQLHCIGVVRLIFVGVARSVLASYMAPPCGKQTPVIYDMIMHDPSVSRYRSEP